MITRRELSVAFAGAALAVKAKAARVELKSRAAEAVAITPEERRARIERARVLMATEKIDTVIMAGGTSLEYFAGVRWWNSERLFVMAMMREGDPFFVSPAFEEERAREQITAGFGKADAQVFTWQEDDDPYARVATALRDRHAGTGRIGIEERVPFVFADGIGRALPHAALTSATPITAGCRMIKSDREIALMRLASAVTLQAYEWTWRQIAEGMTQRDVSGLVSTAYQHLGFPGEASVQVGRFTALPHGSKEPQVIRKGEMVMIDDGCSVEGYQSDITRSFVVGKPSDKMRRVFDIVKQAQSAALAAARPGVACESADAAARKVIADAGFGPDYKFFSHRVGHGMGMDGHEWPYLVRGNRLPLRAGMTFSDEPGIYIRGEFGIRLEDDMHITGNGAELFTPQSSSLEEPFAI